MPVAVQLDIEQRMRAKRFGQRLKLQQLPVKAQHHITGRQRVILSLGVFAVTQIPLSIAEGVLGVLLFGFFTRVAPAELARLGVITKEAAHV